MVIILNLAKIIIIKGFIINHVPEGKWTNHDIELSIFLKLYIIQTTFF